MLMDGEEKMRDLGTTLWLVGLNPEVLEVVKRSGLGERLGRERMFFTLEQAVDKYQKEYGCINILKKKELDYERCKEREEKVKRKRISCRDPARNSTR